MELGFEVCRKQGRSRNRECPKPIVADGSPDETSMHLEMVQIVSLRVVEGVLKEFP